MKRQRILFRLLSLMLVCLLVIPVSMVTVFALESLTVNNVEKWPTVKVLTDDGKLYLGHKVKHIALNDDEIVRDASGNQVDGHFEITSRAEANLGVGENKKLSIKFVPDNADAYKGFTKLSSPDVTYTCNKTIPVFVDEEADPLVATAAEFGRPLNLSVLSGGTLDTWPVSGQVNLSNYSWEWKEPETIVTAEGYYTAVFKSHVNVEVIEKDVFVSVTGATKIDTQFKAEIPDMTFVYDGVTTYGDILEKLAPVAVERGTDTVVEGEFRIYSQYDVENPTTVVQNTMTSIIKFTPADTEKYAGTEVRFTITVEKGTPAWTTGEKLVLTYGYGTSPFTTYGGQMHELDASNLNCYVTGTNRWSGYNFYTYDLDKNPVTIRASEKLDVGTYEYLLKVTSSHINADKWDIENTYLPVQIIIAPANVQMQTFSYNNVTNEISGNYGTNYLNGTVDITIGDETIEDVTVTMGRFSSTWTPADTKTDKTYDVTVKYNAAENDNAVVENDYISSIDFKANRAVTMGDYIELKIGTSLYNPDPNNNAWGTHNLYAGQEVVLKSTSGDFLYWVITDSNGNEIDLGIDVNEKEVSFVMPQCNLKIDHVTQYMLDEQEKLDNCECLCHSDNEFVQFFWKIFVRIITILEQLFGQDILCECGYNHCAKTAF